MTRPTTKKLTDYPLHLRRTFVFKEPKCAVCDKLIVIGEKYYAKPAYWTHEGCVRKNRKN